ncbi:MAG: hypothetical protein USCAAHI_03222 [Beijerinckiaceae bacterium]|nr:MAG: hypothetical protein USCAAHI_03222 [Beijerinckiaceae bacterium]
MIDRDRRYDRRPRPRDDIGCIEPSAETGFQQQIIGGMLAEKLECRRGGDFEESYRLALIGLFTGGQSGKKFGVTDELSATFRTESDAFMKAHQMRRGIDMNALSRRFENGAHESNRRTLAIRSRDMNDRRQARLRRSERGKQPLDPPKREFDRLAMQSEKACEERV